MKNIIKTAICLIVISSILLYSSVSHAASITVTVSAPSTAYQVDLISSEYYEDDSTTPPTTWNYFTYEFYFSPYITTAQDSYKNGNINILCLVDNYIPTGCTKTGITFDFEYSNTETIIGRMIDYNDYGGRRVMLSYYLNNYGLNSSIPAGRVKCRVTFKASGLQWASFNINPTVSYTVASSTSVYAEPNPQDMGFASIIKESITNALSLGELDLVYDYLVFWKTTQDGYLADIELSVDEVETWLSYINSAQATLQNKIDLIYTLELTFPGYFNSMISLLQQIRDMNASDTAAESQMQNAEQQLSQAVNDMEVQKPNINNVVNAGDQYMDSNITGAQGDTFFWLHGTNIFVTILTMAVTIGILGFVIYGKSG